MLLTQKVDLIPLEFLGWKSDPLTEQGFLKISGCKTSSWETELGTLSLCSHASRFYVLLYGIKISTGKAVCFSLLCRLLADRNCFSLLFLQWLAQIAVDIYIFGFINILWTVLMKQLRFYMEQWLFFKPTNKYLPANNYLSSTDLNQWLLDFSNRNPQ